MTHRSLTPLTASALALVCATAMSACLPAPQTGEPGGSAGEPPGASPDSGPGGQQATPDAKPSPLPGWCSGQPSDFSFFVTSMSALWRLSGSPEGSLTGGFGGDFGGLAGADAICQTIAEATGNGHKTWRAFLSATSDGSGSPVHAIDRIGSGPWTDANGRLVATGINGLLRSRPDGDPQTTSDLPDECGVPLSVLGDAHDIVTGSDRNGRLASRDLESTCNDWTSSSGDVGGDGTFIGGRVMCGHSFPRAGGGDGRHWLSDHQLRGCGKGANLQQDGPGSGSCIGCAGGYGALYCFAL